MLITLKLIYLIYFLINLQTTLCLFEFKKVEYNDNHGVQFTNDELLNAVNMGEQNFEHMKNSEVSISNSDVKLSYESPSYGQFLESLPNQQAKEINKIAQIILKASIQLYNFNCLLSRRSTKDGCAKIISSYTLPHSSVHQNCTLLKEQSNNLYTYRRLLPPNYVDGIHKMKVNPLPKTISNKFFDSQMLNVSNEHYDSTNEGILDPERNIALVQWAQFIEHDLAKTVFQTMSGNDDPIECCKSDFTHLAPRFTHPSCAPLKIESSSQFNDVIRCMNYVRSALGVHHNCKFGSAEQLNQATNLLDLSQLYGSTREEINSIRTFQNGQLKTSGDLETSCLPESNATDRLCMHKSNAADDICYKAGDTRVNANPYVTTLYTIFLRSHNILAKRIRTNNVAASDNHIYEKAKRLNKFIYQKIIYEEWAKIILGNDVINRINNESFQAARKLNDKRVSNEFATAAIRFYYSMIPGDLHVNENNILLPTQSNLINSLRKITMKLENEYYKPNDLENNMDNLIDAILKQKAMAMDSGYVDDVIKHLFRFPIAARQNQSVGTDILALDIIRGRDHGLANYIAYLKECTKDEINSWEDLKKYIKEKDVEMLKEIYISIEKIDLIVGAITELPKQGSTVGPTIQCIIGEQLSNTRRSDDAFYSHPSQINFYNEISQYTGAKLLCETTKLTEVPRNIFKIPSERNTLVKCNTL